MNVLKLCRSLSMNNWWRALFLPLMLVFFPPCLSRHFLSSHRLSHAGSTCVGFLSTLIWALTSEWVQGSWSVLWVVCPLVEGSLLSGVDSALSCPLLYSQRVNGAVCEHGLPAGLGAGAGKAVWDAEPSSGGGAEVMCRHPAPPPPQHAGNAVMPPRLMFPLFLMHVFHGKYLGFTLRVVCGHLHPPIHLDLLCEG